MAIAYGYHRMGVNCAAFEQRDIYKGLILLGNAYSGSHPLLDTQVIS